VAAPSVSEATYPPACHALPPSHLPTPSTMKISLPRRSPILFVRPACGRRRRAPPHGCLPLPPHPLHPPHGVWGLAAAGRAPPPPPPPSACHPRGGHGATVDRHRLRVANGWGGMGARRGRAWAHQRQCRLPGERCGRKRHPGHVGAGAGAGWAAAGRRQCRRRRPQLVGGRGGGAEDGRKPRLRRAPRRHGRPARRGRGASAP